MRKIIGMVTLLLAFSPLAYAETVGDSVRETKDDAVQMKRKAGREVRSTGRQVRKAGRKARQAVITRCADGRHTIQGRRGCAGHGGVSDPA